ncbi:MAG: efflux RND transporter periplasmic adaptor subunit [Gammaproteobacteria bacterium]|nr:efflux RND transporter periplasmic adaptor subunit [Gammaproteobacteria bacterium]
MNKWTSTMILIVVLLFGTVIGFNLYKQKKIAEFLASQIPSEFPVTAVRVEGKSWTPGINSIGFIEPNQGVDLEAEEAGKVVSLNFKSGQRVTVGDILVEQDQAVEQANLKSSEGRLPFVKASYERMAKLVAKGNISKSDFDKANSDYLELVAQIESLKATIARHSISAPFDGVVGIRNVFLGQYLQPGDEITRLEDTNVMRIRFSIPQTRLSDVSVGQSLKVTVDAFPRFIFTGQITAIDSAVDLQSGVIELQASIPNNQGQLRSGMFAKVTVVLPSEANQVVVPLSAVTFALYGESVYVIKEVKDKKGKTFKEVKQVVVEVSERVGNTAKIVSGIKAGDLIVTSGQVRLSNESRVKLVTSDNLNTPEKLPKL